jgi:hypothetical protein
MRRCTQCNIQLTNRHKIKFCSNSCQHDYQYEQYISGWKKGVNDGGIGITVKSISAHLRRYLTEKYKEECSMCGWNKKHPEMGHCPLEIEHIDGNSENNKESNLVLLCPNCHALSPHYKNLNRGNGRKWRTSKYIKNTPHIPILTNIC